MANNIARLGVILGLSTAEFTTGIQNAKRETKELEASFNQLKTGAALVGAAMAATVAQVMAFSDQIADTADAYEMTIGKMLDLSEALAQSGGDAESAGRLLASFTNKVDEAANGSKQAQESFRKLGISLKDIGSMTNEELLDKTLASLAKIEDPIKRNALAFDVMGKAIKGVDLLKMSETMLHGVGATDAQKEAVRNLADQYDKLNLVLFKTKLYVAEAVSPAFKTLETNFGDLGRTAEQVAKFIAHAFEGLAFGIGATIEVVKLGAAGANNILRSLNPFGPSLEELNKKSTANFLKNMKELAASTQKPEEKKTGNGNVSRDVKAAKDSEAEKTKNMLETARLISAEYERQQEFSFNQLKVRNAMVAMTDDERRVQEAVNAVMDSTSRKIDEITKKREEAAGHGADQRVIDEYDTQIAKVEELGAKFVEMTALQEQAAINAQRTFAFGWDRAFRQYAEASENYGRMAQDMFASFTNNMNSAISNFVENGKFSFSQFASSVIKDLIRIQMQLLASQLLSKLIGGIMGAVSVTPGVSTNPAFMGPATPAGFVPVPQADGGDITAGMPYYVGENGPELVIPSRNGTVIPNNKLGMGNNQPQVVYNGPYIQNMSAIDTQSAMQFLAQNKAAVYAANLSASRSIPTSVR